MDLCLPGSCCEDSYGSRLSSRAHQGIFEWGKLSINFILDELPLKLRIQLNAFCYIFTCSCWYFLTSLLVFLGRNHATTAAPKYCSSYGCCYSAPKLVHCYRISIKVCTVSCNFLALIMVIRHYQEHCSDFWVVYWLQLCLWTAEAVCIDFCINRVQEKCWMRSVG